MCAVSLRTTGIKDSSMFIYRNGLAEILRPDKKFLRVTVARGRICQPFLDFVPDPQGIDACGLAIFACDEELSAAPQCGKSMRRNSQPPFRVDLH
jgi:hypothetical protein